MRRKIFITAYLVVMLLSLMPVVNDIPDASHSIQQQNLFSKAEGLEIGSVVFTEHGSKTFLGDNRWRYRSSIGETNTWNGTHYLRYVYDLDNKQVSIGRLTFTHGPNGVISVSHSGSGSMIGKLKWYAQYYLSDQWNNFTFDNYEYLGATKTDENATVYQRWWSTNGELNVSYTYYYWNELKMRATATNWAAQTVPVRVLWAMTDIRLTGVDYSLVYDNGVAVGVKIGNEQSIYWHDVTESTPEININPVLDKENRRAAVVFGNMSSVLAQYETMDIDPTYTVAADIDDDWWRYPYGSPTHTTTDNNIRYDNDTNSFPNIARGQVRFSLSISKNSMINSADFYGYETFSQGTDPTHYMYRIDETNVGSLEGDSSMPSIDITPTVEWVSDFGAFEWSPAINVTDIIQEQVNLDGWVYNYYIGFAFETPEEDASGQHGFEDYQAAGTNHAYVTIDYTASDYLYAQQISNLYSPSDMGTHSDFDEMRDKDAVYDTLTEADIVEIPSEWKYVDGLSAAETVWTTAGASPYLDAQDEPTNRIWTGVNDAISSWYTFAATSGYSSGSNIFTVNASVYWACTDAGDGAVDWEVDWTNDDTADASGSFSTQTTYSWDNTGTLSGLDTFTEVNDARIRFTADKGAGGPNDVSVDAARIGIAETGTNYDLDLEVGWISANYTLANEELCIYGGTQGSEALRVDVWSGSWTNVFTDITVGWNNVSVTSYLTDATFEIRFTDTTNESVEADTWQVEAVLLHTWGVAGNEYQEYVFETIPFSDTITTIVDFSTTVNELIGIFETVVVSASFHLQILEQILFSDTTSLTVGFFISILEILGLAVTTSVSAGMGVTKFETIGFVETAVAYGSFSTTVSEIIEFTDLSTISAGLSNTIFELLGLVDTVKTAQGAQYLVFETIGFASVVIVAGSFSNIVNEMIGLSDLTTVAASMSQTAFETIPFAESVQVSRGALAVIMETIGLTSVVVVSAGYSNTITELLGLVEATQPAASISITRYEVIDLFEYVVTTVGGVNEYYVTIFEVIGVSEGVTVSMGASAIVFETIGLVDMTAAFRGFSITVFEVIGLSESTATSQLTHYYVYEVIGIISSIGVAGGIIPTPQTESVFYQIFFSLEMWGYLGPIALVIGGYVVVNKDRILGILFFVVECLFISHYLTLVAETPDYWWHIIILLFGGMLTIVYALWERR